MRERAVCSKLKDLRKRATFFRPKWAKTVFLPSASHSQNVRIRLWYDRSELSNLLNPTSSSETFLFSLPTTISRSSFNFTPPPPPFLLDLPIPFILHLQRCTSPPFSPLPSPSFLFLLLTPTQTYQPLKKGQKPLGRIAIIGAGLTGVSSAAHAVDNGFEVIIFESSSVCPSFLSLSLSLSFLLLSLPILPPSLDWRD